MTNRYTRLNSILSNINNFKFALAVGHGQHEPSLPPVLVPKDTYVIFTTKPGYLGYTGNVVNEKFEIIFKNRAKLRQLLLGTLPQGEIPNLITNRQWNWKNHIYPPGSLIANHSLEFYDHPVSTDTEARAMGRRLYDKSCGLWVIPMDRRKLYGTKQNLQTILNRARRSQTGKLIVFISGCRGDPAVSEESLRHAESFVPNTFQRYFQVPQNYNIPFTNYINSVRTLENQSRRYVTRKRMASNMGARKRTRINNTLNLSALNNSKPNFSKYRNMINNIRNKNMNIVTAKATYPEFFKNIQNKNVLEMIKGMKNTNTNNIQAHLPRPGPNNNSALNKIAYRIRTLMNRR